MKKLFGNLYINRVANEKENHMVPETIMLTQRIKVLKFEDYYEESSERVFIGDFYTDKETGARYKGEW